MVDQVKLYTVADLEAMPEDEHTQRELLNGRLITTRIDSRLHQVVHNRLQSLLKRMKCGKSLIHATTYAVI